MLNFGGQARCIIGDVQISDPHFSETKLVSRIYCFILNCKLERFSPSTLYYEQQRGFFYIPEVSNQ